MVIDMTGVLLGEFPVERAGVAPFMAVTIVDRADTGPSPC
jgi:hypothetical protein